MSFKIRPAIETDIPFILKGVRIVEDRSYDKVPNALNTERLMRDVFAEPPKAHILVAEVDGALAGFVIYSFYYLASEGEGIWLTNVYIDPFCRKTNLGKTLYDDLKTRYPDAVAIYGAVAQSNTIARHFFAKVGAQRFEDYRIYGAKWKNND